MTLESLLSQKRAGILKKWLDLMFESYPPETSRFLKREKDHFDNPVAYEFRQGIEGIYEALLSEMDTDRLFSFLDQVIRIRAVQDLSPSQAIAFIFLLKKVIREKLEKEAWGNGVAEGLLELESRIDGLALLSFDVYMKRREMFYELRVDEVKRRVGALLRRTGLIAELEEEPGFKEKKH
jgi:hypothetical protein